MNSNTTSDNSKWLYETILKYHEWYLRQISITNHAIIFLYYYPRKICKFYMYVFQKKLKIPLL